MEYVLLGMIITIIVVGLYFRERNIVMESMYLALALAVIVVLIWGDK
jgi:hypothetical protein